MILSTGYDGGYIEDVFYGAGHYVLQTCHCLIGPHQTQSIAKHASKLKNLNL